jgi:hypothetical protein
MLVKSYRKCESVEISEPSYPAQISYNTWWHLADAVTHNSKKLTVAVRGLGHLSDQSNPGGSINPVVYLVGSGGEAVIGTKKVVTMTLANPGVDVAAAYVKGGSPAAVVDLNEAMGDKTEVWTFVFTPTSADGGTVVVTGSKHVGNTWTATISHTGVLNSMTAWLGWVTKAQQLRFAAAGAGEVYGCVNAIYNSAAVAAV